MKNHFVDTKFIRINVLSNINIHIIFMKKILTSTVLLFGCLFITGVLKAQPPAAIPFQAVAKDPQGNIAKNRTIYVKDAIYQTSANGTLVWEETHVVTSDNDGIFVVSIGRGTRSPGITAQTLSDISWANGPFFLNMKVAISPSIPASWWIAADNYLDMGTTQMLSVPYALFAGNASVTNVNTSITPGPPNTFLITDSLGNVNWQTPKAAQQNITTVSNFLLNLQNIYGQDVSIAPNTTSVVTIPFPGVRQGDPVFANPLNDYPQWSVYQSWAPVNDTIKIRFANFTSKPVVIFGSQYKIVVIK